MTWFKVDDQLHDHKKARRLGKDKLAASGLWVLCGSWSADTLSDGFVPDEIVERFDPKQVYAKRLVEVELWHRVEHDGEPGYEFHDWDEYQPTRDKVLGDRQAWRDRKQKSRKGSRVESRSDTQRDSQGESREDSRVESNGESQRPVPVPVPVPKDEDSLRSSSSATEAADLFEDFWSAYPRKDGKAAARKAWPKAVKRLEAPRLVAAARYWAGLWAKAGVERQFIPHPATWLNGDRWNDQPPAPRASPTDGYASPTDQNIAAFLGKTQQPPALQLLEGGST